VPCGDLKDALQQRVRECRLWLWPLAWTPPVRALMKLLKGLQVSKAWF
jgi:hypothetical protein